MAFRLSKYVPLVWKSDRPAPIGPQLPETPVILFVPGLSSTARESWQSWFDLASKDDNLLAYRLDTFDYPTAMFSLPRLMRMPLVDELSRLLLAEIAAKYPESAKIVLVCHSMGGLVAKQAMIDEVKSGRGIGRFQLVLCGVPHAGSEVANFAKALPWGQRHLVQLSETSELLAMQATEWERFDLERRVRSQYIVGGKDVIVLPKSACVNLAGNNVNYCADLDHSTIISPENGAYEALLSFLASGHAGVNPLFDIYSAEDEPYYLRRPNVDDPAEAAIRHSNMWLYGPSGSGKTTLMRHAAHKGGWRILNIMLSGYEGSSTEQLMTAVRSELFFALSELPPPESQDQSEIKRLLSKHAQNIPLCILIEEIPCSLPQDWANFVYRLSQLTTLIDVDDQLRGKVRIAVTSIMKPNTRLADSSAKVQERIQFTETRLWEQQDLIRLVEIISPASGIELSPNDQSYLVGNADGHPRFVKQVFRDLKNQPARFVEIRDRVDSMREELVR